MSNKLIDREDLEKAIAPRELMARLAGHQALILGSFIAFIISALLLVYISFDKNRLEMVYLDQTHLDAPMKLAKMEMAQDSLKTDRWIRGFTRQFIKYYFVQPDDSTAQSKYSLMWLEAHTGKAGQSRSLQLMNDFGNYDEIRKNIYSTFYPLNKITSLKIRKSKQSDNEFHVEIPGTYVTRNKNGDGYLDASLRLILRQVSISGIPLSLGGENVIGLIVEDGYLEYVEDATISTEKTRHPLFEKSL
jgi:hypothetical protein